MAAVNATSYLYGRSNLDAAAFPQVVTLDGGDVRTLQVLVPGGRIRPIDPTTGDTIPLTEVRGSGNEELTEYPVTDAIGEWVFYLIGYPICDLGITGPETGALEKIYKRVFSGDAIEELIGLLPTIGTGGSFTGTVDWGTQVTGKPAIPSTAADVGAIPTSARAAADGVAPLTGLLVPFGFLPVGTTSTTVSRGDHTHAGSYDILPAGVAVTVYETSAGVWPARPTIRPDIPIQWVGSIQPTIAQGWRDLDHWLNVVVVS